MGKQICVAYGYKHRHNHSTKCSSGGCSLSKCCKDKVYVPQPPREETCQDFFDVMGKQTCVDNGYKHRHNHSTKCSSGGCSLSKCCKDKVPQPAQEVTCQDFFDVM
eukprot:Awhi_evm1s13118